MYKNTTEKEVKVGEKFLVEFPTNAASTGYIWEPTFYDENLFEIMQKYDTDGIDERLIGGSTMHIFEIEAKEKGRGKIEFRCHQPWTEESTTDIEVYDVTVE